MSDRRTLMKFIAILPIAIISMLTIQGCKRRSHTSLTSWNPHPQPPAANADEWVQRISPEKSLSHGFAELPPEVEWPAILKQLRQPGDDLRVMQLRLFGEVLAEDNEAAAQTIRALLLKKPDRVKRYERTESLRYIYTFSKDTAAASEWVTKSLPPADPESPPDNGINEEIRKLLLENKVDEALAKLREEADKEKRATEKIDHLENLMLIARLMEKQSIYEKALAESKAIAIEIPKGEVYSNYQFKGLLKELALLKDWQFIQKIATRYRDESSFYSISLVATYHLDGPAAFLAKLRDVANFKVVDEKTYLAMLTQNSLDLTSHLGELIIRSYMVAGEKENARVTLTYLLALEMGNDIFYRLAIEYFPDQAEAMFEAVRPSNNFEERPLIWLAELALKKNDLARAQQLIDQAITLDPSDGDQRKYTRMQAYDVLSRLKRAQGDIKKSDFLAEVVRAIRKGEEADDFLEAGLLPEAIRRYQEALGHFNDAYCLQSRLAKTLLKAGKEKEAMEHFKKTFELMPLSFGPVESHCFGCEHIFEDERVQQIALATFNRLIESTPKNPRTFYLLGILFEEMKRPEEAIVAMKKALELDPNYYNCAKRVVELLNQNPATQKDAQVALVNLVSMAPYEDLQYIFSKRTDLRQTWLDAQTPKPAPLKREALPLPFAPDNAKAAAGWHYFGAKIKALDGWTTQELLEDNSFMEWIDGF